MFLLYSSTSSSVCIEVSVGAAADNNLLQNGIKLSSSVWPHKHSRVCPTSIKTIFSLSYRTGHCFNNFSLLMIFTGGISAVWGWLLASVAHFPPGRCVGVQAPKAFCFLRFFSTAWGSSTCERGEGREGQRKGTEKSSSLYVCNALKQLSACSNALKPI